MLNKYDFNKLLHDISRITKIIPILRDTSQKKQREKIAQLALDELQKLYDDLEEVKKSNGGN
jgi:hypothetical protein